MECRSGRSARQEGVHETGSAERDPGSGIPRRRRGLPRELHRGQEVSGARQMPRLPALTRALRTAVIAGGRAREGGRAALDAGLCRGQGAGPVRGQVVGRGRRGDGPTNRSWATRAAARISKLPAAPPTTDAAPKPARPITKRVRRPSRSPSRPPSSSRLPNAGAYPVMTLTQRGHPQPAAVAEAQVLLRLGQRDVHDGHIGHDRRHRAASAATAAVTSRPLASGPPRRRAPGRPGGRGR